MDALLILGGLVLIVAGLVWMVILAFGTSLLWGIGSLFAPVTLAFLLCHWRVARKALILSALGIIPLVVGLTLMASQDAQRLEAILSLRWLEAPAEKPAELNMALGGELHGEPFNPQHGELVEGLLSLREGQDFFAQREIRIRLPQHVSGPLKVDVLPDDRGNLPEVEVSWLLPEQDLPEARRLTRGYTLHLDLQPQAPNKLAGDFHLVLPPRYATTLSGRIEVFRNGLRYREGRIDYRFDSRDTLAQVVSDHLKRRFAARTVALEPLPAVVFPASRLELEVHALVDGQRRTVVLELVKHAEAGWRVAADPFPPLKPRADSGSSPSATGVQAASEPRAATVPAALHLDRDFSLLVLLSSPKQYLGRPMKVELSRGGSAEGDFTGLVDGGLIQLRRNMRGADAAVFVFHPDDIAHIELLDE